MYLNRNHHWRETTQEKQNVPTQTTLDGVVAPTHAGSSLADFSTLKMEATRSSETSVQFTRATRRHIPEDGILHSHRCENLKSYIIKS
jgi:hypothetical protein